MFGVRRATKEFCTTLREILDENSRISAENAELRDLVRTMMQFFEDGDWCDKCDHARECDSEEQYEDDCLMRFVFRDRMHELGIEAES